MIQLCRLIAHHQGAVHTVHTHTQHTHTHARTHTHAEAHGCSLLGRRMSALRNLAAWEMFMLMPQTHSGGGRAPRRSALDPSRVLQAAAQKRFCLQGSKAWGGSSGGGGFAALGRHPGELSWGVWSGVRARREADARPQIRKCVRVNKYMWFYVLKFSSASPPWSLGDEEEVGSEHEEEKRNTLSLCLFSTDLWRRARQVWDWAQN